MKITISFATDGTSTVEAHGFKGASCQEATQFLEQTLGTGTIQLKPEFHQQSTIKAQLINRQH